MAVVLSIVTTWLDATHSERLRAIVPLLFQGTAGGARTLLSVVAGSVITVVAMIFSLTIVALQQASTQFTPRVIRNFIEHRGNRFVLGTYVATFTFSVLVLRQVRSETDIADRFMPSFSIFIAILLVVFDLGLLVYFIHHTARSLQVSYVIEAIRTDLGRVIDSNFGEAHQAGSDLSFEQAHADAVRVRSDEASVVRAARDGYLRTIDYDAIERELPEGTELVVVPRRVGDYVFAGAPIAFTYGPSTGDEGTAERMADAFVIQQIWTTSDEPLFGIRQLADIALKALSPGINDPTTAEQVLDALGGVLVSLARRQLPYPVESLHDGIVLIRRVHTLDDYVDECFGQIRRAARGTPHVLVHMLDVLAQVGDVCIERERLSRLRHHVQEIVSEIEKDDVTSADRAFVREGARRAHAMLTAT